MAAKAGSKPRKRKPAVKASASLATDRDGFVRIYTRISPKDAVRFQKVCKADERSGIQYLRRLLLDHLDQIEVTRPKRGK